MTYTHGISTQTYLKHKDYFDTGLISLLEKQDKQIKTLNDLNNRYSLKIIKDKSIIKTLGFQLKEKNNINNSLKSKLNDNKLNNDEIINSLKKDYDKLDKKIKDELQKAYNDNVKINEELQRALKIIEELKKDKNKKRVDSTNSSLPPSSDVGVHVSNSRVKSNKSRGGQAGHPVHRSSCFDDVSEIVEKHVKCAPHGAVAVYGAYDQLLYYRTQEIDMHVSTKIKEIRYYIDNNSDDISDLINMYKINAVSYSAHFKAMTLFLATKGTISLKRLCTILNEMSDNTINLKEATIVNWMKDFSLSSKPYTDKILEDLLASQKIGVDETGAKINGSNAWEHVLVNDKNAYFIITSKRKDDEKGPIALLENFEGILTHDHYKPYYDLKKCSHVECNAHILRYLKAGVDLDKNVSCQKMIILLQKMLHAKNEAIKKGNLKFEEKTIEDWENEYLNIAQDEINKYKKLNPKISKKYEADYIKLLKRMIEYKDQHLLFIRNFDAPFENNWSERQMRFVKLHKKVSGQSYSIERANEYAALQTVMQTCSLKHINALDEFEAILRN